MVTYVNVYLKKKKACNLFKHFDLVSRGWECMVFYDDILTIVIRFLCIKDVAV